MTSYIPLEFALRILSNAYLVSVVLLLAFSYLGLSAIETMEKAAENSTNKNWFI